jgi:hypothetical protein
LTKVNVALSREKENFRVQLENANLEVERIQESLDTNRNEIAELLFDLNQTKEEADVEAKEVVRLNQLYNEANQIIIIWIIVGLESALVELREKDSEVSQLTDCINEKTREFAECQSQYHEQIVHLQADVTNVNSMLTANQKDLEAANDRVLNLEDSVKAKDTEIKKLSYLLAAKESSVKQFSIK